MLDHTVHRGQVGVSLGPESFSYLDFSDDVALLTEMLSVAYVCKLAMEIMQAEAENFGMEINWVNKNAARYPNSETKVQCCDDRPMSWPRLVKLGPRIAEKVLSVLTHSLKLHAKTR